MAFGTKLAFEQSSLRVQRFQYRFRYTIVEAKAHRNLSYGERRVRARVPANEFQQRFGRWAQPYLGQPRRQGDTKRIAITRSVFHGDESFLPGKAYLKRAA